MIRYELRLSDPQKHILEVTTRISDPGPRPVLRMPSWIPGSYLLREFARHVISVHARCREVSVPFEKIDKSAWSFEADGDELEVTMRVYALDESVRGAFFDTRRAYFNGPCVFAWQQDRENEPVELTIVPSEHARAQNWQIATAMTPVDTDDSGFGRYTASNYDELIDHPFEIGRLLSAGFEAGGVQHRIAIAGRVDTDIDRICTDLGQLCTTQIDFFGRPAPFDRYVFLGLATSSGYGGLEHRASSSLMFSRDDLPRVAEPGVPASYQKFLGLVSHEYFHSWQIKRTKPDAFMPYRLGERNHTRQLWIFEGITSYYQELFLLRSSLVGVQAFLQRLSETLTRVYRAPGRAWQSLAQSSFDAWDVLYKPTPGTVNSAVSYYSKGALVALALDLTLRKGSDSACTLDVLVKALWARYGSQGAGVPEGAFEELASELSGQDLQGFFDEAVRGTADLPLQPLLEDFGIALSLRAQTSPADRGGATSDTPEALSLGAAWRDVPRGLELTAVFDDGPAEQGGLNPGDVLIALDGYALDSTSLRRITGRLEEGERVRVSAFRDGELIERDLTMEAAAANTLALRLLDDIGETARGLRVAWLGE